MSINPDAVIIDSDNENYDSDRTELYTPPPLNTTNELNSSSEKENQCENLNLNKEHSIIVLDSSFQQVHTEPNDYWDQWPLDSAGFNNNENVKLYSIPDIDMPPSSPVQKTNLPLPVHIANEIENNILDIITCSPLLKETQTRNNFQRKKAITKQNRKMKRPMSEYRAPSPFSPKPDYKTMDIENLKRHAMKYGLSTTLSKGRIIKILDEIYTCTHQYETDTDYEFETNTSDIEENSNRKDLSHTPPTPAIIPNIKKVKKRPAIHQMSSSDEAEEHLSSISKNVTSSAVSEDNENNGQTDDDDVDHQGRFLELTVHDLSTTTVSSSSESNVDNSPSLCPSNENPCETRKQSTDVFSQPIAIKSTKSKKKPSTPIVTSDSDTTATQTSKKRPKLQTPTVPLKEIVRNYITSKPNLHVRVLCYEPIDFEEFHKQIKDDLHIRIASKELMHTLDDQCITFTLRSRKGTFKNVMRAKRRQK